MSSTARGVTANRVGIDIAGEGEEAQVLSWECPGRNGRRTPRKEPLMTPVGSRWSLPSPHTATGSRPDPRITALACLDTRVYWRPGSASLDPHLAGLVASSLAPRRPPEHPRVAWLSLTIYRR